MWLDVSRRNLRRGSFWGLLPAAALLGAAASRSLWPAGAAALLFSAAALRTAFKVRRRSTSLLTLLLFGAHAHFQEIPILLGQLRYWHAPAQQLSAPGQGGLGEGLHSAFACGERG